MTICTPRPPDNLHKIILWAQSSATADETQEMCLFGLVFSWIYDYKFIDGDETALQLNSYVIQILI